MISISLVTASLVTKDKLQELVRSWGGEWLELDTNSKLFREKYNISEGLDGYGTLSPRDKFPARVSISFTHNISLDYSPEDILDLTHTLGSEPLTSITVGYGNDSESYELAKDAIKGLLDRFGGIQLE